jgi:hypothetical protein
MYMIKKIETNYEVENLSRKTNQKNSFEFNQDKYTLKKCCFFIYKLEIENIYR